MQLQLTASPRRFLQMLLWLRALAIVGQSVTILTVQHLLGLSLPMGALAAAIGALSVLALLSALRLRTALPATQLEIAVQLALDVAQLTAVLYLSGGTTNPFASLFLVPVAFGAAALAWRYVFTLTLISLGCYVWLIGHFRALALMPANPAAAFDLHMVGMHVTFSLSTLLLASALALMAAEIRRRNQSFAALREETLRHEHLSAMGLLAAGAAHELSTPLFSMAMLVTELREARSVDEQFRDDLALLDRQIQLCKQRLTTLLRAARPAGTPGLHRAPAHQLLQQVLDNWSTVRPGVRLQVDWQPLSEGTLLEVDEGFSQALTSLLDNAADASAARSSERVQIAIVRAGEQLQIVIDDEGSGLRESLRQRAGSAVFTTKPAGFGLGLMLSHANLSRLNGRITLSNRPGGGTRTVLTIPAIQAEAHAAV